MDFIPTRNKDTDISSEVLRGKRFGENIKKLALNIAKSVVENDNAIEEVAKVALQEKFNREQLKRLIEETNTISFVLIYGNKKKEKDKRVYFEIADFDKVIDYMGDDAPPVMENPNFNMEDHKTPSFAKSASPSFANAFSKQASFIQKEAKLEDEFKKKANLRNEIIDFNNNIEKLASGIYRNQEQANTLLNYVCNSVGLSKGTFDKIAKIVNDKKEFMEKRAGINTDKKLVLVHDSMIKIASNLMGTQSLLSREDFSKVSEPTVIKSESAKDYQAFVDLAKKIKQNQEQINVNGGV